VPHKTNDVWLRGTRAGRPVTARKPRRPTHDRPRARARGPDGPRTKPTAAARARPKSCVHNTRRATPWTPALPQPPTQSRGRMCEPDGRKVAHSSCSCWFLAAPADDNSNGGGAQPAHNRGAPQSAAACAVLTSAIISGPPPSPVTYPSRVVTSRLPPQHPSMSTHMRCPPRPWPPGHGPQACRAIEACTTRPACVPLCRPPGFSARHLYVVSTSSLRLQVLGRVAASSTPVAIAASRLLHRRPEAGVAVTQLHPRRPAQQRRP